MASTTFSVTKGGFTFLDNATASDVLNANFSWVRLLDLRVVLFGLTHSFASDLDFLLVAPSGVGFEFWSDAGAAFSITNGNFTIADSGASPLPINAAIPSGTYRPTDYTPTEASSNWGGLAPNVTINHPAPNGTATFNAVFGGMSLGGNWSLYVRDDVSLDVGSLEGWAISGTVALIVKPSDFNGNRFSDILWQNSDGTPAIWLMNSATNTAFVGVVGPFNPGPSWQIKEHGDFNGDAKSDILWQNSDGTPAIWLMDGTSVLTNGPAGPFNPGASWQIKATGDFNFDTKADILWQGADGTPAIWLMDGLTVLTNGPAGAFNPGPSWQIKGTGDFNKDGMSDILWHGADGTPAIWLMNGINAVAVGAVGPFNPGPSWHVQGTGDYNGDGRSDILWQSDDGTPAIWLMDGLTFLSGGAAGSFNPGQDWHVIA